MPRFGGAFQILHAETIASGFDENRLRYRRSRQLDAEHDDASRDADREDVETEADARPEVHLKEDAAQP
jgi:hypothetical protein